MTNQERYECVLDTVRRLERAGKIEEAIANLHYASGLTCDAQELAQIEVWVKRLRTEKK